MVDGRTSIGKAITAEVLQIWTWREVRCYYIGSFSILTSVGVHVFTVPKVHVIYLLHIIIAGSINRDSVHARWPCRAAAPSAVARHFAQKKLNFDLFTKIMITIFIIIIIIHKFEYDYTSGNTNFWQ